MDKPKTLVKSSVDENNKSPSTDRNASRPKNKSPSSEANSFFLKFANKKEDPDSASK